MICCEDGESIFECINLVIFWEQDTFLEANSFIAFLMQYAFQVFCGSHDVIELF